MLKDVQGQVDQRHIALKQVGIRDIRWPITLKDPHKGVQHSVAVISLGVNLPMKAAGNPYEPICGVSQKWDPFILMIWKSSLMGSKKS